MEIRIGKFMLCSDQYVFWIMETYTSKGKDGKPGKPQTKKVAGYSRTMSQLYESFIGHKFRCSEATTVAELLKDLKQLEQDLSEMRKTATKEDFKKLRAVGKTIKQGGK